MATYNGEKYIKEQVDSILKQLGPEDEIIVSDDGSKDATIETLRSYCDVRIKIYHHTSCGANSFEKASSNFENALTKATGDIIFLSDQDDIWTDDKVKVMVDGLKNNLMVQCQLAPFSADSETSYQQTVSYLTFSGSFALMNNQSDVVEASQFRNGNAYLKSVTVNEYPEIILPIKTDYTEWDTLIQNAQDNPVTVEGQEDGDSREVARLFLIYNYQKGENYQILSENNTLENKTLLTFDFAPDSTDELFYDSNKNSLCKLSYR